MPKKWRWKVWGLVTLIVVSIYLLLPTFVPLPVEALPKWIQFVVPIKKINLGLDLQGGLHLVLGVGTEQALRDNLNRLSAHLKSDLKEEGLEGVDVSLRSEDNSIVVKASSPEQLDRAKGRVDEVWKQFELLERSGTELVLQLSSAEKSFILQRTLDQSIETIRNRIDEFGVAEPSIQGQGMDRVVVQLPGVTDPKRAKDLIGRTAKLEFRIVDRSINSDELQKMISEAETALGIRFDANIRLSDYTRQINEHLRARLPTGRVIAFERREEEAGKTRALIPYLLEATATVTGDHLQDAFVQIDQQYNTPYVSISFNPEGGRLFKELTEAHVGEQLAIVLDEVVHSAPLIKEAIPQGSARIDLGTARDYNTLLDEAKDTSIVLRAGALPAPLEFLEERTVGPSLGRDSIQQGSFALLIGGILVVLFMVFYYRKSGLVADVALTLNVVFILAVLAALQATLTLPGIAGIVLTMGMAVDGNILIFERIREELRLGKTPGAAVDGGFAKALWTILDANITTLIAGIVLLQYGTGPVRGFAVTLIIGIFSSLFTAITVSRLFFDYNVQRRDVKELSI